MVWQLQESNSIHAKPAYENLKETTYQKKTLQNIPNHLRKEKKSTFIQKNNET